MAEALSGFGSRLDWWSFRDGFTLLKWAAFVGLAAVVMGGVTAFRTRSGRGRRGFGWALTGVALGALATGVPALWMVRAQRVPAIHDISTDTENPPVFSVLLALRRDATNPATYGGPEVAAQQRRAYPDIAPLLLKRPPAEALQLALKVGRELGWVIVDAEPESGRLEATAVTFWFGFKDDVVVRVRPADGGSRLDIRSLSRVGKSDVGANAERIRRFLRRMAELSR